VNKEANMTTRGADKPAKRKPSFRMSKEDSIDLELGLMRERLESQGHELKPGYLSYLHVACTVLSVEPLPDGRIKVRVRLEDSGLNHASVYHTNFGGQVVEVTCPDWHFRTWDPVERKRHTKASA
jgi:hypothetical protein